MSAALVLSACSSGSDVEEGTGKSQQAIVSGLSGFVFLATGHVSMQDRTQVIGGDVGVAAGTGDSINTTFDTKIGIGRSVIGQRIVLGDRTVAGNLFVTTLIAPHATFASQSPFSAPPVAPAIAAFSAGTAALTVNGGQTVTLAAGSFGQVTVNGTLNLSGGSYQVQNLTLGPDGAVVALAPSILRVAGRISAADRSRITTTSNAGALRVFVAGADDTTGGVVLGNDARLSALMVSRAGFRAGDRLIASGALAARDIALAHDSTFTFDSGFACNTDASCDDNNPCTTDLCVDTQCRHNPALDGTSCSDSNACTGADHCQAGACVPGAPVACDDGLFCNGAETCNGSSGCVPGAPPPISDGVDCTDDSCNEATDSISHLPNNARCGSGFQCNATAGCVDINECANGSANCDSNATCTNTNGGFACACNSGFTGDGHTCTPTCTPMTVGFGVQRCVLARQDGSVDLFLSPDGTNKYQDRSGGSPPPYLQSDEPEQNFCGPTAGKNQLFWYGTDPAYGSLAGAMKANSWTADVFDSRCQDLCLPFDFVCEAACDALAIPAFAAFSGAGTLPEDMNGVMDSLKPPGYVRCNNGDDITLPQLQWSLAHGNPVIFLESRAENNLHWAVISGLYRDTPSSELKLRFLNSSPDVNFAEYQSNASIEKVSQGTGSSLVKGFLDNVLGINPTIIRYAKASDILQGTSNVCDDWHSNDLTTQAGGPPIPPLAAGTSVVGYATTFNDQNQQHVVFIDTSFHVQELFYTDHWQGSDLIQQATNATDHPPPVAPGSVLGAYTTTFNNQQHVDYISADGHINELMHDTAWHWRDLTADSDAPQALVTSSLTGYQTTYGVGQQHVNFLDSTSGHVIELFINAGGAHWQKSDLTDTALKADGTKPPKPRANSPLTGYQTAWNSQQHVDFIDSTSGDIWELYFDSSWHALDLTTNAGAAPPKSASPLSAYTSDVNGNQQHLIFIDTNDHVQEMFFTGSLPWVAGDLNVKAGIPNIAALSTGLHGYTTTYTSPHQQHVNFVSASDRHIYELFFDNVNWHARDLTKAPVPPAPLPVTGSQVTGYETTWNRQQHVDYIGADGHVYELFL
jgi:hypothetical protein